MITSEQSAHSTFDAKNFYIPSLPKALMSTSRQEVDKTCFKVKAGEIPQDLSGHAFMMASVGFGNDPYGDGTPLFNGDGMIYRFDCDQAGEVSFKTKLAKTPCFYADVATQSHDAKHRHLRFHSLGFGRFSFFLGLRNEVNTALLPFQMKEDEHERLLVTYDAGRPYEIDPVSLEVVTPIGRNSEWRIETPIRYVFSPALGTAHPWFDQQTHQLFSVNYARDISNLLGSIPLVRFFEKLGAWSEPLLRLMRSLLTHEKVAPWAQTQARQWARNSDPVALENYVYIVRWDGNDELERWKLVLPDGQSVVIEQTIHQIGVTQDYVILVDTAFSFGLEQMLNNPLPKSQEFEKLLRSFLSSPQEPISAMYLVKRRDLINGQRPHLGENDVMVTAIPVKLPLELVHFVVDYENPEGQITLHAAHNCASDVSQVLKSYDYSAYPPHRSVKTYLDGLVGSQMDINRLGRYVIDGETGTILDSKVTYDSTLSWGVGLYTFFDNPAIHQSRIQQMYWQSFGYWPETLSKFIFSKYEHYRYRAVPVGDLIDGIEQRHQKPSSLFRMDTESMVIADSYTFPLKSEGYPGWDAHLCGSPQFIPRRDGTDHPTDGYILCTAIADSAKELWIFDAANLAQGPLCRLYHEDFDIGFTLHTTWMSEIHEHSASYKIGVREDYQPLIDKMPAELKSNIQDLFDQEIYPNFDV